MSKDQKRGHAEGGEEQEEEKKKGVEKAGIPSWEEWKEQDLERRGKKRAKMRSGLEKKKEERETRSFGSWQKKKITAREAALYSNLRIEFDTGNISASSIKEYLRDFPSDNEYEAFKKVSEALEAEKLGGDGGLVEEMRRAIKSKSKESGYRRVDARDKEWRERMGLLLEAVKARVGVAGPPRAAAVGGKSFSAAEWEEAILREYAAGRINDDDLKSFSDYYSKAKKAAYEKLAAEEKIEWINTEAGIEWDELGDKLLMSAGFRKELVKNIPTEEGRTVFEEMLDEQIDSFKQILRETISQEEQEKKLSEFGGDKEKAEEELIAEAARKFLAVQELFTHGILGYDKEKNQMVLKRYSDLDGKCAIALFGKAGLDISKVGYLTPGEKKQGQITVDSSNVDGFVQESAETVDQETGERKVEITTVFDHHGPHSDRETSATKSVYEVLTKLGVLKFENEAEQKNYEKVVNWVTKSDNFSFPNIGKYFDSSNLRMIGFLKFAKLDQLLAFARSGKNVTDLVSAGELKKYDFSSEQRDKIIKEAKRQVDELAPEIKIKDPKTGKEKIVRTGWSVETKNGLFLVDTRGRSENDLENKARGELQWAAASAGFAGIIRYNTETQGFFVALNQGEFDPKSFDGLPQGKLIRKSMFLKSEGREKLVLGLGDLINRLSPGFEPGPGQEKMKRFLDSEPWRVRAVVSLATGKEGYGKEEKTVGLFWWANTPSGKKIAVYGLPDKFRSGDEAILDLHLPQEKIKKINYAGTDEILKRIREINERPKDILKNKEFQKAVIKKLREIIDNLGRVLGGSYEALETAKETVANMEAMGIKKYDDPGILEEIEKVSKNLEEMFSDVNKNYCVGFYESDEVTLPRKPEIRKAPVKTENAPAKFETRKQQPAAKVEAKKPSAPEAKIVLPKPETKPAVPKLEKGRTPEERKRIEGEIAAGKEGFRRGAFFKAMEILENEKAFKNRSREFRADVARGMARIGADQWEKEERKKYGV